MITGLELGAAAAAAAGYMGLRQRHIDNRELAKIEELPELHANLVAARRACDREHKAITTAWKEPLSLFPGAREIEARHRGVPEGHISCVKMVARLAHVKVGRVDLAEVYVAQLTRAEQDGARGKGLARNPVLALAAKLEEMERRLKAHLPAVQAARSVFDSENPAEAAKDEASDAEDDDEQMEIFRCDSIELPLSILQDRGFQRLPELVANRDSAAFARLVHLRTTNKIKARSRAKREVGATPTSDTIQVGLRLLFVRTGPKQYKAGFQNDQIVDVLKIEDEQTVEVLFESREKVSVQLVDLRFIQGAPQQYVNVGEEFVFKKHSSYDYPAQCVQGELVKVLQRLDDWACPAHVQWANSGEDYWVHFQDLCPPRSSWLTELRSVVKDDREAVLEVLDNVVSYNYSDVVDTSVIQEMQRLAFEDIDTTFPATPPEDPDGEPVVNIANSIRVYEALVSNRPERWGIIVPRNVGELNV